MPANAESIFAACSYFFVFILRQCSILVFKSQTENLIVCRIFFEHKGSFTQEKLSVLGVRFDGNAKF